MDPLALGALSGYGRALLLGGDLDRAHDAALQVRGAGDLTRQVPAHVHALVTLTLVEVALGRLGQRRGTSTRPRTWSGRSARAGAGSEGTSSSRPGRCCSRRATPLKPTDGWQPQSGCSAMRSPPSITRGACCCLPGRMRSGGGWTRPPSCPTGPVTPWMNSPTPASCPGSWRRSSRRSPSARERTTAGEVVTALSDAELTVLRLIAEGLSIREIGARLYVSENTVRTHRRAVYRKLGVHSRDEAVARATALGDPGRRVAPAGDGPDRMSNRGLPIRWPCLPHRPSTVTSVA